MRLRNVLVSLVVVLLAAVPVFASHGWSTYHWGRSCATCARSITLYSSLTTTNTNWADHLNKSTFGDPANPNTSNRRGWNDSAALTLSITAGATDSTTRANCPSVTSHVRVCNYTYGSNGWLGLAQISLVSGTSHINWGTTKVNDTYFNTGSYPNTEKRHVMCQETGHDYGLGHTSENGSSQNTCMDYYRNTSSSDWTSTGPNQHDFDQLLTQHHWGSKTFLPGDNVTTLSLPYGDGFNEPWQWGTPEGWDDEGRPNLFRVVIGTDSEGNEHELLTHVYWAHPVKTGSDRSPAIDRIDQ